MSIKIPMNEEVDYNFQGWERKIFCTRFDITQRDQESWS